MLMKDALECDFSMKIRIYYALFKYLQDNNISFGKYNFELPEELCFGAIKDVGIPVVMDQTVEGDEVVVSLRIKNMKKPK